MGHEIAGEVVEVGVGRRWLVGRRRRAGDRRDPGRHVRGVPPGPDDGVHEPDVDGLPVRGRLRRVHDRAARGAGGRRAQPDPRRASASPRRRSPSRSPASSTARSWPGWARATTSWSSAPARSAACTCGWPGRAAPGGSSSSTSTAGGWTCPRVRCIPTPRSAVREVDTIDEVRKLTDGRGADVVITAAAAGKAQEDGLQMLARGGRLSAFGGLPKDKPNITVDANLVHYRELTIVGANGSSPDAQQAGARDDRLRRGARERPDHRPAAARPRSTRRSTRWPRARRSRSRSSPEDRRWSRPAAPRPSSEESAGTRTTSASGGPPTATHADTDSYGAQPARRRC